MKNRSNLSYHLIPLYELRVEAKRLFHSRLALYRLTCDDVIMCCIQAFIQHQHPTSVQTYFAIDEIMDNVAMNHIGEIYVERQFMDTEWRQAQAELVSVGLGFLNQIEDMLKQLFSSPRILSIQPEGKYGEDYIFAVTTFCDKDYGNAPKTTYGNNGYQLRN